MQIGAEKAFSLSLLKHWRALMGPLGLYQHATGTEPLLTAGYCTDDNARAVSFLIRLRPLLAEEERKTVETFLERCWRFVVEAEQPSGQYFNFRTAGGEWLSTPESDDMYARLVRMLMLVLVRDISSERRAAAAAMWDRLGRRIARLTAIRGWAEALVGLTETGAFSYAGSLTTELGERLFRQWQQQATKDWPWFEPMMTYANALLPHAVLRLWQSGQTQVENVLHQSARFLLATTMRGDMFVPVGNRGWYRHGAAQPALYDQQPIEAGTMSDFLLDYQRAYPDRVTKEMVAAPYLWFFGHNSRGVTLADPERGTCFDGLHADRMNQNCGAESLLAYLWAEVRIRESLPELADYAFKRRDELLAEIKG